jgi:hypothetical protein
MFCYKETPFVLGGEYNTNSDISFTVRNLQSCYHYHMRKLTGHPFDQGVAQVTMMMMMMMYYSWESMLIETIGHPGDPLG